MPTYEYKCNKCGEVFEEFQSITAKPLKKCIKEGCDGDVERLFSGGAGFIFKGSGFYQTDYKNKQSDGGSKSKDTKKGENSSKSTEKTPAD